MQGFGLKVKGLRFGVQNRGVKIKGRKRGQLREVAMDLFGGVRIRVWNMGCRVKGLAFAVHCLGFRISCWKLIHTFSSALSLRSTSNT